MFFGNHLFADQWKERHETYSRLLYEVSVKRRCKVASNTALQPTCYKLLPFLIPTAWLMEWF